MQYLCFKTNLDFTWARDVEWQWHQLDYIQVRTSLQTDNHTSTPPPPPLRLFTGLNNVLNEARCPSCRPTNSIKALNNKKMVK